MKIDKHSRDSGMPDRNVGEPGMGVERHPVGYVGHLFRVVDPDSIRVGLCFMAGRIKRNDLVLCIAHGGDWFQEYIFVEEFDNGLGGMPSYEFGSYGIGDAVEETKYELTDAAFSKLAKGRMVYFAEEPPEDPEVYIRVTEAKEPVLGHDDVCEPVRKALEDLHG